jgi:hypothetical protein
VHLTWCNAADAAVTSAYCGVTLRFGAQCAAVQPMRCRR